MASVSTRYHLDRRLAIALFVLLLGAIALPAHQAFNWQSNY
ncbi:MULTISPECIES: hypothetical protein [unclassified Microcoleus]